MVEVRLDTKRALERLDRMVGRAAPAARGLLERTGAFHVREMGKRFVPYGQRDPIQVRTGAARRAFGFAVEGDRLRIYAGGLSYLRIQETGGTIRPRARQYLTVPLPAALTAGGALRGGARLVERGGRWETADGKPTVIFTSKAGNKIIAERGGPPLYVLKPSVTLKPRLGFVRTFRERTEPYVRGEAARLARELLA